VLTRQCEIPGLDAGGGFVTECEPQAFAAGLSAVLDDPHRAERARFARERVLASQTAERRADAYAELFRTIAIGSESIGEARAVATR